VKAYPERKRHAVQSIIFGRLKAINVQIAGNPKTIVRFQRKEMVML
jgi:hypothetical protein